MTYSLSSDRINARSALVSGQPLAPSFPTESTSAKPRLLDQVREACRVRHYSLRTEDAYVQWIRRFVTTDWRWQWVFPSYTISVDPRTGWRGEIYRRGAEDMP